MTCVGCLELLAPRCCQGAVGSAGVPPWISRGTTIRYSRIGYVRTLGQANGGGGRRMEFEDNRQPRHRHSIRPQDTDPPGALPCRFFIENIRHTPDAAEPRIDLDPNADLRCKRMLPVLWPSRPHSRRITRVKAKGGRFLPLRRFANVRGKARVSRSRGFGYAPSGCSNSFRIVTLEAFPNRPAHTNSAEEALTISSAGIFRGHLIWPDTRQAMVASNTYRNKRQTSSPGVCWLPGFSLVPCLIDFAGRRSS
jgi:hypothetical protein